MRKKLFFSIGIFMLCLAGYGLYLYNKPHSDTSALTADFTVNAADLYRAFDQNENMAGKTYLDKIIAVKGAIEMIEKTDTTFTILLKSADPLGGINCNIAASQYQTQTIKEGDVVTVKGRCSGFLADVALVDCVIENKH